MKLLSKKEGARFLSNDETRLLFSSWNKGLIINGKNLRMSERDSFANLAVFAKSGVGKTSSISFPNLIDLAHRDVSVCVNDPKGELFDNLSGYFKFKGFKVIKYDIMEISHDSYFFNPFAYIENDIELDFICDLIVNVSNPNTYGTDIFNSGAIKLLRILAKCLSYGPKDKYNLPELYRTLRRFGDMGAGLNEWVYEHSRNPVTGDREVFHEWNSFITGGNEDGIMSFVLTATTCLSQFANDHFRAFYADNSFDLNTFRDQKTAIFYVTPPDKQSYFSFSTSIFFRTLFSIAMRKRFLDSDTARPCYFMYDEFGNSYVPSFADIITTSRAYKISCTIILQSITQLTSKYGAIDSKTIIEGGFSTYLTLHSGNTETNSFFEKLVGRVIETRQKSLIDSRTERVEYNLMNQDEIRRLGDDEALVIYRNKQAMKIRVLPHYRNKKFQAVKEFGRLPMLAPPRGYTRS